MLAEREGPSDNPDDVTDEVKVLREEEARAAAEVAELETECTALRQRGLRLSTEADAAEALIAQRRGLLQHAQQQRDVAKEAATRLELGTSDPAVAGLTSDLDEARRASSKTKSEEVAIREALAMLRGSLEAEEARGQAEAKEHAIQQSRLLEELAAAEQSRPAQKIVSLETAHRTAVQHAAKGSSQRAGLAAELARLRAHEVVQRRLLATATAEVEASQRAASANGRRGLDGRCPATPALGGAPGRSKRGGRSAGLLGDGHERALGSFRGGGGCTAGRVVLALGGAGTAGGTASSVQRAAIGTHRCLRSRGQALRDASKGGGDFLGIRGAGAAFGCRAGRACGSPAKLP